MHLVKKLLIQTKYSNVVDEFEDLFSSHPNYPSLFAITDSLNLLEIDNIAIKIPKEQFAELPEIFLTLYKGEMVLLYKNKEGVTIEDEKGKKKKLTSQEFLPDWDLIIIAVEPNSGKQTKTIANYKWLSFVLPILLLIVFSGFLNGFSIYPLLFLNTSMLGLFLSVLILQEKFDIKTELVSKFCNLSPESSCDSVIKSDKGTITSWLSFTDLPVLFFGINFFSLLLQPVQSVPIVAGLSLIAVPFLVYSVWVQKVKIKKWCLLCLAVATVIFIQGVFFPFIQNSAIAFDSLTGTLTYLFSVILVFSGWMLLKPIVEKEIKATKEVKELKRFKRSFKVFQSLTKEVKSEITLQKFKGIEFGKPNFSTNIILFLSPSCGHCHKAFQDAYELYKWNPESVYLNVLFNINPENENNRFKTIVESLLIVNSFDSQKAQEALIDWHIHNLDIEAWKDKWQVATNDMLVNNEMQSQYDWCLSNELNYTPIKIVNSKLFPNEYEISELKFFAGDFEEEFQSHYEKIIQN